MEDGETPLPQPPDEPMSADESENESGDADNEDSDEEGDDKEPTAKRARQGGVKTARALGGGGRKTNGHAECKDRVRSQRRRVRASANRTLHELKNRGELDADIINLVLIELCSGEQRRRRLRKAS